MKTLKIIRSILHLSQKLLMLKLIQLCLYRTSKDLSWWNVVQNRSSFSSTWVMKAPLKIYLRKLMNTTKRWKGRLLWQRIKSLRPLHLMKRRIIWFKCIKIWTCTNFLCPGKPRMRLLKIRIPLPCQKGVHIIWLSVNCMRKF